MTIELLARIELLEKENKELKEELERADQLIHSSCFLTNEEMTTGVRNIIKENEKLNHYKLLYQKVKDRNDKAIRYIKKNKHYISIEDMNMYLYESDINKVLEILKGNNE